MSGSRYLYLCLLFIVVSISALGQSNMGSVKGTVRDTAQNLVLRAATVSIYKDADSTLVDYRLTDNYGSFNFKSLSKDYDYRLEVSYIGYRIKKLMFNFRNNETIDFNILPLESKSDTLNEVNITVPPISVVGDTLEINASAFKMDKSAVVEDLLRRIPNIVIWGDGQITVNGRKIKSLVVNGQSFFGGDAKIATQNIDKDAVDKIQIYRKNSDIKNSLDSTLEMNVKLKKGRDKGYFGKVGVGIGTDRRMEIDGNINMFSSKFQFSVVGATNNTNKLADNVETLLKNSSFKGIGTNINYQPDFRKAGINKSTVYGINALYNFKAPSQIGEKSVAKSNYFSREINSDLSSQTQSTTILNNTDKIIEKNNQQSISVNRENTFSSNFDFVKGNHTLSFFQHYLKRSGQHENTESGDAANQNQEIISTNNSFNSNKFYNHDLSVGANYRFLKKNVGESIRFNALNLSYSAKIQSDDNEISSLSTFKSFIDESDSRSFNRQSMRGYRHILNNLRIEIPSLKQLIFNDVNLIGLDFRFIGDVTVRKSNENNNVKDYNNSTSTYTTNAFLTNDMQTNSNEELFGLEIERSFIKSLSNRFYRGWKILLYPNHRSVSQQNTSTLNFQNISAGYRQFAPDALISFTDHQFGVYNNTLKISYSTTVDIPTVQQLAALPDSTNLYFLRIGNNNLKNVTERKVNVNFNHESLRAKNPIAYFAIASIGMKDRQIVDSALVGADNRRVVFYANAPGHRYFSLNGEIRKSFKFNTFTLQLGSSGNIYISKNPTFLNSQLIYSDDLRESMDLSVICRKGDRWDLALSQTFERYHSRQRRFDTEYSGANTDTKASFSINIAGSLTLNSNISYYNSSITDSREINFTIWNAGAIYRMTEKKNLEVKLTALDILRQNTDIINYGSINRFTIGSKNALKQYFMITMSYFPRQFGANK